MGEVGRGMRIGAGVALDASARDVFDALGGLVGTVTVGVMIPPSD